MNLHEQEPALIPNYRTKRPDKFDNCPSCGKLKRKHGELCRECRKAFRPVIDQPDDPFVRHIPLTQGQYAIVDTHLYDWLMEYKWCALWNGKTRSYYACAIVDGVTTSMHRLILGLKRGDPRVGDHENSGHTTDNRGQNLRPATGDQNAKNRRMNRTNTSGFKGVSKSGNRYQAHICIGGKLTHLGTRDTAEAAHRELYAPAALKYHGEFARLA